jgi:hypothetical protein
VETCRRGGGSVDETERQSGDSAAGAPGGTRAKGRAAVGCGRSGQAAVGGRRWRVSKLFL